MKDGDSLYKIRHSLAHVLAQAVKDQFPDAKLGFGPPIENGFYYDFDLGEAKVHESDLKNIEKRMKKIIGQNQSFAKEEMNADQARDKLASEGELYKVENVGSLENRGEKNFTFFQNGKFVDLCEGPHVEKTGALKTAGFKLDRIAGAYWLGDEKNKMLTRIYGLAFESRDELDMYLKRRKMAEDFDHKKLGKELELYTLNDIVGPGLILWMPNGTIIRDEIEKYAVELENKYDYQRVSTPHITKAELYHRSQHLPAYAESMYPPMVFEEDGRKTEYYLRPMNCPHHHLIFDARKRSYKELPLRLAEYGTIYRYEQSGELSGLIRVRCMSLNDAHIYLRQEQFKEEFLSIMKLYDTFYKTFGLKDYQYRLSVRGKDNTSKYKGDSKLWDVGEKMLADAMDELGIEYYIGEGEAAFYGPKIDIQFRNLMGREETVSTIQVDFLNGVNFGLKYTDEDGKDQVPLIIHRAPLSTHERFVSYLIEYYGGAFPTWCSPVQVCLIPVKESCMEYTKKLAVDFKENNIRVEIDESDHSFNKKIRNNTVRKIPIMLIIGERERDENKVTVRRYGVKEQENLGVDQFRDGVLEEIRERKLLREPLSIL